MIQKTVYFRTQEDLDRFNAIQNKAEWLHEHLSGLELRTIEPIIVQSVIADELLNKLYEPKKAVKGKLFQYCEHYQVRGQCLIKGCKYGKGRK